jgi:hypothetical protein
MLPPSSFRIALPFPPGGPWFSRGLFSPHNEFSVWAHWSPCGGVTMAQGLTARFEPFCTLPESRAGLPFRQEWRKPLAIHDLPFCIPRPFCPYLRRFKLGYFRCVTHCPAIIAREARDVRIPLRGRNGFYHADGWHVCYLRCRCRIPRRWGAARRVSGAGHPPATVAKCWSAMVGVPLNVSGILRMPPRVPTCGWRHTDHRCATVPGAGYVPAGSRCPSGRRPGTSPSPDQRPGERCRP